MIRSATSTREKLLADIHDFVTTTGMSASDLGRAAVGDGSLVGRLKAGRDITTEKLDRVYAFMAAARARLAAKRAGEAAETAARKAMAPEPAP